MDQQHVAVCLGVGGGAPMDQQQGAGSGELTTMTDVMTRQGFGAAAPIWYVCHVRTFYLKGAQALDGVVAPFGIYDLCEDNRRVTGGC